MVRILYAPEADVSPEPKLVRVLLLEDNVDAAESLTQVLKAFDGDYEIESASRLAEAEYLARTARPEIALVDLTLPDARGCEAIVALRAAEPQLPLVALTAHEFGSIGLDLVRCGAQDVLQKGTTSVERIHQVLQLVVERHQQESTWRRDASYDWLTGALRRNEIERQLEKAVSRTSRSASLGALLVIDVDDFKSVNDSYGHAAGDAALTELATRVGALARAGDSLGRLGGDEFALVVEGLSCGEDAVSVAERVLEASCFEFKLDGTVIRLSVSIGVALFRDESADVGMLLELADQAMYGAKRAGKGAFRFVAYSVADTDDPERSATSAGGAASPGAGTRHGNAPFE